MSVLKVKDENGNWIGITSVQGEQGIQGEQGPAGYTPVKGKDYWTEEDIKTIQDYIDVQLGDIEALLGGI